VLAICDRPRSKSKRGNQRSVPGPFVVVGESAAIIPNLDDFFIELDEVVGMALRCRPFFGAHGVTRLTAKDRIKWVLREHVLDIRDQQFLVLLLMVNPENDDRFDFIEYPFIRT